MTSKDFFFFKLAISSSVNSSLLSGLFKKEVKKEPELYK